MKLEDGILKEFRKENKLGQYEEIKLDISIKELMKRARKDERKRILEDEINFLSNELIFMNDLVGCNACIISKNRVKERIEALKKEVGK